MNLRCLSIAAVLWIASPLLLSADLPGQDNIRTGSGLIMQAHETGKENRTSLDLTPGGGLKLKEGFTLEFEVRHRLELQNYGYICRIAAGDSVNIDLISNVQDGLVMISLVLRDTQLQSFHLPFDPDRWLPVTLKMDPSGQTILFTAGDLTEAVHSTVPPTGDVRITFGASDHRHFATTDVAPVTVRNLKVLDHSGAPVRSWPMDRHGEGYILDETGGHKAVVHNALWETDRHLRWRLLAEFDMMGYQPKVAYNDSTGHVYVIRQTTLYDYSVRDETLSSTPTAEGFPYQSSVNNLICDRATGRLISYNILHPDLVTYDPSGALWNNRNSVQDNTLLHHTRRIASDRGELILFGGYEEYLYSAILWKRPLGEGKWEYKDLSASIAPRYLSASAYLGDGRMLVLGGYGSSSGRQQESPRYYHDLHLIDTDTGEVTSIWEIDDPRLHQLYGNSLVVDGEAVYALAFDNTRNETFLRLNRFSLDSPSRTELADSIPYFFHDINSYCDLFLDRQTGQLIAVTSRLSGENTSRIAIYGLAFPPLTRDDVYQAEAGYPPAWILLSIIIISGAAATIIYRRRKSQIGKGTIIADPTPEATIPVTKRSAPRPSSVLLLGGFQIIDTAGRDITGHFTPILSNLFLFILLNTIKNGKGVTSRQIDDTFWFSMDKASATNNRNVNMRKLRILLQGVEGVRIVNHNSYWSMEIDEGVTCDYGEIHALLHHVRSSRRPDRDKLDRIIELALKGKMLPRMKEEWIDEYISEYTSLIIEVLFGLSRDEAVREDPKLLLNISNVMLVHDNIDEDAVMLKCHVLYKMGKAGLAKNYFANFCAEYEKVMDCKPALTFEKIIRG